MRPTTATCDACCGAFLALFLELAEIDATRERAAVFVFDDPGRRGQPLRARYARGERAPAKALLNSYRALVRGAMLARSRPSRTISGCELREHEEQLDAERRAPIGAAR